MTYLAPKESIVRSNMRRYFRHYYLYRWWYRASKLHKWQFVSVFALFFVCGFVNNVIVQEPNKPFNWIIAVYFLAMIAWGILATVDNRIQLAYLKKAFRKSNAQLKAAAEPQISWVEFTKIVLDLGYTHA